MIIGGKQLNAVGFDLNGTLATRKENKYYEVEDSISLVYELCRHGVRLALVSDSSPHMIDRILRDIGLERELFTVILSANDFQQRPKPDPFIWVQAKQMLAPDGNMVAVENAPAGVTSAKRAGCTVWAVTTTHTAHELWRAGAKVVEKNFAKLAEKFGFEVAP